MVPILDTVKEARLDRSSTLVKNLLLLCLINIAVIWQLMTEWYIHRPVLHLFSPEKLLAVDGKWHRDPQHGQHVESERLWSTQPQMDCIMKCLYSRNRYIWEKKKEERKPGSSRGCGWLKQLLGFFDSTGLMHVWSHRGCNSMNRTCTNAHQTKSWWKRWSG